MTESHSGTSHSDETLQKIASTIEASVLGGDKVYIDNAFEDLLEKAPKSEKRTKGEWKPSFWKPTGYIKYDFQQDTCPYIVERVDLRNSSDTRRDFVMEGKKKFEKNDQFWGVCNDFSWVCTSILTVRNFGTGSKRKGALLPPSYRVEWYAWKGITGDDHAFTVVNRAEGSSETDWSTWGVGCFVVDQWYALQTRTSPVKALDETSTFYDGVFLEWWKHILSKRLETKQGKTARNTLRSLAEFESLSYP